MGPRNTRARDTPVLCLRYGAFSVYQYVELVCIPHSGWIYFLFLININRFSHRANLCESAGADEWEMQLILSHLCCLSLVLRFKENTFHTFIYLMKKMIYCQYDAINIKAFDTFSLAYLVAVFYPYIIWLKMALLM